MKIAIVYIFPMDGALGYLDLAARFIHSYHRCPPEEEHQTIIVSQGKVSEESHFLFLSLPNTTHFSHDNSGYDIGAFQHVSREIPADLMVFFGATSYLKCTGWLRRMRESFQKHGNTLYGTMGNRGVAHVGVMPHIRTTGFWMSPSLFNKYPMVVSRPDQRYLFEHGQNCLTSWIVNQGKIPWVVAYDGDYPMTQWDMIPNGYHQGDQSNLLSGDRMTYPPYYHVE